MTDFTKETTATAIHFYANTPKAVKQVALKTDFYWQFFDSANDAMTFNLPKDKRHADAYLRRLLDAGYTVEEGQ